MFCNLLGPFERILLRSAVMSDHHDAKIDGGCTKVWEKTVVFLAGFYDL